MTVFCKCGELAEYAEYFALRGGNLVFQEYTCRRCAAETKKAEPQSRFARLAYNNGGKGRRFRVGAQPGRVSSSAALQAEHHKKLGGRTGNATPEHTENLKQQGA